MKRIGFGFGDFYVRKYKYVLLALNFLKNILQAIIKYTYSRIRLKSLNDQFFPNQLCRYISLKCPGLYDKTKNIEHFDFYIFQNSMQPTDPLEISYRL